MQVRPMILATLAAASLTAACSTGGSREDRGEPIRALLSADALLFGDFDTDRDFSVSMAEIEVGVTQAFASADANHDNSIGPIEFQTWANSVLGGGATGPYRLDFDRNVDNIISAEEFRTELVARAHAYDADENGSVTRAELVRQVNQTRPAHIPQAPMRSDRMPSPR